METARREHLLPALFILTFVTGLVDAVSFLGLGHVFTANMTGNVVFLGFAAAGVEGLSAPRSLASLAGFLLGAMLGGRLGIAMKANERRWLITAASMEAALLVTTAVAALGFDVASTVPASQLYAVIILSALAMGLRNATVRQLAVADMTTTVATLTLTGIAADSAFAGGTNPRLWRRAGSVLCMCAGAAIGALLVRNGMFAPLALSALCAIAVTLTVATVRAKGSEEP